MERRVENNATVESVFVGEDGTEHKCRGTILPDKMTFKDANGEEHNIFLDLGTHKTAYQHVIDQNWEELKKFPKWAGQTHNYENEAKRTTGSEERRDVEGKREEEEASK